VIAEPSAIPPAQPSAAGLGKTSQMKRSRGNLMFLTDFSVVLMYVSQPKRRRRILRGGTA